ncbi:MAG TPA: sugar phosphate nucleotidyltransferase [Thermoleophilaceae bacterium]|jgi:glucose-1-phosphate cytidylyltransferase|nr:sugar phosphate nucleotidyltransferase [Thermoleophilaceae bacterium]
MPRVIPVAILCGGKGTRMTHHDVTVPKPLVEIGGRPILWHVMSIYAAHGLNRFVLLCGHGAQDVKAFASTAPADWDVTCVDTGLDTPTGGRVARAREHLENGTFCLTYADGVADIDLDALLAFHKDEGAAATMTVVQPQNPWGVAQLSGERVSGFDEKPPLDCWVNGGFFVMEPRALDAIGPDDVLERRPLETLANQSELAAYRHAGFWDCMDTYKDTLLLNELWEQGRAPWRTLVEARR